MVNTFSVDYIIKNKKVIFFDFDDTLCIHLRLMLNDYTHNAWQSAMFEQRTDFYSNSDSHVAPKKMISFVRKVKDAGIICHCVTWSSDNRVAVPKSEFLKYNYGECIENLYVAGSREYKFKLVTEYCKHYDVSLDEVLLVDDHPDTLNEFRKAGIECISPVAILSCYED